MAWSRMADLALTDDEKERMMAPMSAESRPDYPWGLCITLTEKELEKLDLDDDVDVGDMIDLRAFGEVTGVHKSDGCCRVEIQLQRMAVENEMNEEQDGEDC